MILDTNALSAFVDGDPDLEVVLGGVAWVAIPVIVLGEFLYGIADSRHRSTYEEWLERYIPQFHILTVTEETTPFYAELRAALKRVGRPIPANDAWIAAIALEHGLQLLSRDVHFDVVPGLVRKSW